MRQQLTTRPYTPLTHYVTAQPAVGIRLGYAVVLGLLVVMGMLFQRRLVAQAYTRETAGIEAPLAMIEPVYAPKVAQATDVEKLMTSGHTLLAKNMPYFAALNYARATELDPNLRDAAYGWAVAIIRQSNGTLAEAQQADLAHALALAEKVDPLYVPVITLKLELARQMNDTLTVEALQERLKIISKT